MKKTEALITPEVLKWARMSLEMTIEYAAQKIGIKEKKLESWENGSLKPTIKQLEKIASIYKRPESVFYLNSTPEESYYIPEFRSFRGDKKRKSPELNYLIRKTYQLRELAMDVADEVVEFNSFMIDEKSINNSAENIRQLLNIDINSQFKWKDFYQALNSWQNSIENLGVLVFKNSSVELDEMRGFCISEKKFPVILINNKDVVQARIFTMLHEFCHLLSKKSAMCDLSDKEEESQCNEIAGCVLVPEDILLNEISKLSSFSDTDIDYLSSRFKVSNSVILKRLLSLRKISTDYYGTKKKLYEERFINSIKNEDGYPPIYRRKISQYGKGFCRIIFDAYYEQRITLRDVSNYLDTKIKHLEIMENAIYGRK